jgi:hypothetical protein
MFVLDDVGRGRQARMTWDELAAMRRQLPNVYALASGMKPGTTRTIKRDGRTLRLRRLS